MQIMHESNTKSIHYKLMKYTKGEFEISINFKICRLSPLNQYSGCSELADIEAQTNLSFNVSEF